MVADALSRKAQCNCVTMDSKIATLCDELCKLNIEVVSSGTLNYISVEPTLHEQIIMAQIGDKGVQVIKDMLEQKVDKYKCFRQDSKGVLWFEDRLVVPKNPELRQKILDEAIRELKRKEFKELFKDEIQKQDDYVSDCTIDTDLEILIPDEYVESITERLSLYSRLDNCENEKALTDFHKEMIDRFGPIPAQVEDLFTTVRCRKLAVDLGFEKMILKDNTLKCFFVANADSPYFNSEVFLKILNFIQTETNKARLKQVGRNGILIVKDISSMNSFYHFLKRMHNAAVLNSPELSENA